MSTWQQEQEARKLDQYLARQERRERLRLFGRGFCLALEVLFLLMSLFYFGCVFGWTWVEWLRAGGMQ